MEIKELNELKKTLHDAIISGTELHKHLELMGDVDTLVAEYKQLKAFYHYFEELYGKGLKIANWHENGDLESFDHFFVSAEEALNGVKEQKK